mgnify:CR=1 FL=1
MTAKDLKNALLQEAVQGKLVPQIASEGNARDLLEEIRRERLSHGLDFANAKSGKRKSKKETASAGSNPCDITEEEIPFDIPESWCWCRLGEIVPFGTCKNAEPNEIEEEDWILDLEDIEKDSGKILAFKTKKQIDAKSTKHVFIKGNVLYSKLRPYLNKCVIAPKNGFCTSEILPLDFGEHIYNKYAQLYLMSPFFVDYTNSLSFGVKMPRLGTEDGKKALFPLPPLAEQKRIVATIEKFMPLIEEYGKKESALKAINEQIGMLTEKAILQEAVQGKLVPQIASEGNARDLLEEIRKEKLSHGLDFANAKSGKRKSKKETALAGSNPCDITEEEIPFDIPESWCWCRITDIATCELGKTKDALKNKGEMKDYLCSINIQEEGIDLSKVKQMKFEENEYERYTVKKNDLLICEGGDAGRCAIYDRDEPMYYQNALHRVRFFCDLNPKFYLYVFQVYKANKILTEASKGVTIQHLTGAALKELYFPLPPLAEQKRIVAAIEKLLPLCEKLGE